jgi:hypothetical protein
MAAAWDSVELVVVVGALLDGDALESDFVPRFARGICRAGMTTGISHAGRARDHTTGVSLDFPVIIYPSKHS